MNTTALPDNEKRRLSGKTWLIILAVALLSCILLSFLLGRYPVPFKELIGILFGKLFGVEQYWTDTQAIAVWNIRMPRILIAVLVGYCLSAAGASYQGVFQNPMAAPDILGASAGAGFGAALAIFLSFSGYGITAFAFMFSLITVALVMFISKYAKGEKVLGLVLAGIMVSSLFQAGTSFIKLVADPNNKLPAITYWLMGSLSGAKMDDMLSALVILAIGTVPLMLLRWRMNFLTCPDEEATAMGINVGLLRIVVIVCATLLTATCVSFSGMIGWVGLAVPHFCRFMVGNNLKKLLPAAMLSGAIFLLVIDNISRNLLTVEIPIGILTAFVGAPFFIVMLIRGDRA